MRWYFGFAEINGVMEWSEPREFDSREQADKIGAWPGLFTFGPYDSAGESREAIARICGSEQ